MVGEVIAASMRDRMVNQSNEGARGVDKRRSVVIDVQVEDHARIGLARPWQSALCIRLDQANRAVYEVGGVTYKVASHIVHENR